MSEGFYWFGIFCVVYLIKQICGCFNSKDIEFSKDEVVDSLFGDKKYIKNIFKNGLPDILAGVVFILWNIVGWRATHSYEFLVNFVLEIGANIFFIILGMSMMFWEPPKPKVNFSLIQCVIQLSLTLMILYQYFKPF